MNVLRKDEPAIAQGLPRILILDKREADTLVIGCYLQMWGFPHTIATSREEASSYVADGNFDLILIDDAMIDSDVVNLVRHIRNLQKRTDKRSHIVAMTVTDALDGKKNYSEMGMDGYITKPCNPRTLAQKLGIDRVESQ